jgi:hypothetical protein
LAQEPTAEAMQLPWVMRQALRLISELQARREAARARALSTVSFRATRGGNSAGC